MLRHEDSQRIKDILSTKDGRIVADFLINLLGGYTPEQVASKIDEIVQAHKDAQRAEQSWTIKLVSVTDSKREPYYPDSTRIRDIWSDKDGVFKAHLASSGIIGRRKAVVSRTLAQVLDSKSELWERGEDGTYKEQKEYTVGDIRIMSDEEILETFDGITALRLEILRTLFGSN